MVHGDISLKNIVFSRAQGGAVLIDFGHALHQNERVYGPWGTHLTPANQAGGLVTLADDIFALGATLQEVRAQLMTCCNLIMLYLVACGLAVSRNQVLRCGRQHSAVLVESVEHERDCYSRIGCLAPAQGRSSGAAGTDPVGVPCTAGPERAYHEDFANRGRHRRRVTYSILLLCDVCDGIQNLIALFSKFIQNNFDMPNLCKSRIVQITKLMPA